MWRGPAPDWMKAANAVSDPDTVPWFIARNVAGGFIVGYPLGAGARPAGANKIVWVVRFPQPGASLNIVGHATDPNTPDVHLTVKPSSASAVVYVSDIDVPTVDCWELDLTWGSYQTVINLLFF